KEMNVKPLIFTKGHVIGDDNLVKRYYSRHGINTGEELIEEIKKCDARILLGFNSFDTDAQDKMVGNIKGYTLKRNRALELLVKTDFNKHNPTHLCLAMNPVTNQNYDEIFEMYVWARERNLYAIVTPSMIGGRCAEEYDWKKITPPKDKLVELYTKIYRYNIERGIQTLEEIKRDGISSYAGGVPCHQVACGMYIALNGTVLRCPGDDITVFGDMKEKSLKDIWLNSENYKKWKGLFNCGCPPKEGKSIPNGLYKKVIFNLEKR
ncbi:MAG: SPASM domain-containing protein, partial [Candidatus Aenigmatarchaeota archaeon]